jgi:hypothetical protein
MVDGFEEEAPWVVLYSTEPVVIVAPAEKNSSKSQLFTN